MTTMGSFEYGNEVHTGPHYFNRYIDKMINLVTLILLAIQERLKSENDYLYVALKSLK